MFPVLSGSTHIQIMLSHHLSQVRDRELPCLSKDLLPVILICWYGIKVFWESEMQPQPHSQGMSSLHFSLWWVLPHSPWAHHTWTCLGCSDIEDTQRPGKSCPALKGWWLHHFSLQQIHSTQIIVSCNHSHLQFSVLYTSGLPSPLTSS